MCLAHPLKFHGGAFDSAVSMRRLVCNFCPALGPVHDPSSRIRSSSCVCIFSPFFSERASAATLNVFLFPTLPCHIVVHVQDLGSSDHGATYHMRSFWSVRPNQHSVQVRGFLPLFPLLFVVSDSPYSLPIYICPIYKHPVTVDVLPGFWCQNIHRTFNTYDTDGARILLSVHAHTTPHHWYGWLVLQ